MLASLADPLTLVRIGSDGRSIPFTLLVAAIGIWILLVRTIGTRTCRGLEIRLRSRTLVCEEVCSDVLRDRLLPVLLLLLHMLTAVRLHHHWVHAHAHGCTFRRVVKFAGRSESACSVLHVEAAVRHPRPHGEVTATATPTILR